MASGVYNAKRKDGSIYFRSNITYHSKHISLGSFDTEAEAHEAYNQAQIILSDRQINIDNVSFTHFILRFDKIISLINFRDNGIYFNSPIYLYSNFFRYFITPTLDFKFDRDDLFYYSNHRILKRNGHLYVNDYGMQYSILNRYGIKSHSVAGRDYMFANGDDTDYRYSNIIVINRYFGVSRFTKNGIFLYKSHIHINGVFIVGIFRDENTAAVAYNKAVDEAHRHGINKNFPENYIEDLSARDYADIYTSISLSKKYMNFLKSTGK